MAEQQESFCCLDVWEHVEAAILNSEGRSMKRITALRLSKMTARRL
ncbi:MAG: hypothetical protein K2P40_17440 [Lachnospiraceae bacterium]|nr:hypothetical protein [Lachnospiraceae bacterium]